MRTLLLALVVIAGCAETPQVKTTLNVHTLKARAQQPPPPALIATGIAEVTAESVEKHGLLVKIPYKTNSGQTLTAMMPLVPLPSFIIKIVNKTDKPLSFAQATVKLEDDRGRGFDPYLETKEVQGRVESYITDTYPSVGDNARLLDAIREGVAKLSLLNNKLVVPPGSEWQGFAMFKLQPKDAVELDAFLKDVKSLTLKVANVTHGAAPIALSFAVDRADLPRSMMCPQGVEPSLAKCKAAE